MGKQKLSINKQVNKSYQELYKEYLKVAKIRNLSPVTIRTYQYHHNYWFQFVHEGLMCSEIDQELIDDYRLHLIDKGLSAVSVNSYINNISPVLKYGVERGYIPNKLSFKQLKEEEKIKEIYTPEELALLLKKPNVKKCSFAEFRNWVIINFLLGTGVRARELRNIKTGNPFVLQRILGHQSMKMLNHYLQMNTDDLKQNIALVNPLEQVTKNRISMKKKGEKVMNDKQMKWKSKTMLFLISQCIHLIWINSGSDGDCMICNNTDIIRSVGCCIYSMFVSATISHFFYSRSMGG